MTTSALDMTAQRPEAATLPRILLAGAVPGEAAGNSVSSSVLLSALSAIGDVGQLSHDIELIPRYREVEYGHRRHMRLGTQPFSAHGEALLAGLLFRRHLSSWECAWAVNSRYAGSLRAARLPYIIWEATTLRDELRATDSAAVRRAGTGTGLGATIHRALLPLGERIEGALYRGAACLLAMSEHTRACMIATHNLSQSSVRLLPHPPSPAFLEALKSTPDRGTAEAHGKASVCRLLFVGRVDDNRKNFPLLLEALTILNRGGIDARLSVVGPHTEQWRRSLEDPIRNGTVTYMGRITVSALAAAYRAHDVLALPSRQEGFGIVVAEAMHAGLPVVSTRCGGPEQVIRESQAGLLVDHDPDAMAAAIATLIHEPDRRKEMGRQGVEYANRVLSLEAFSSAVKSITEQVLRSTGER